MTDDRMAKLETAMDDETFAAKIAECASENELKELLLSKGIAFTDDEVNATFATMKQDPSAELDEKELDNVAGGSILLGIGCVAGAYIAGRIYGWAAKRKLGLC